MATCPSAGLRARRACFAAAFRPGVLDDELEEALECGPVRAVPGPVLALAALRGFGNWSLEC